MRKGTNEHVRQEKIQINLHICTIRSEASLATSLTSFSLRKKNGKKNHAQLKI